MLNYRPVPAKDVGYLIAYPTPGCEHVLTVAGTASSEQAAIEECARLNEAQVTERREDIAREPNMISNDLREQRTAP